MSGGWKGPQPRLYLIWASMKTRCQNPAEPGYRNYGGRGIRVCDEWQEFEPFLKWAKANGYRKHLSLDRINNNGNYEPTNCRWATREQQSLNTRRNRLLTHKGQTMPAKAWANELGVPYGTILSRLRRGWPDEEAVGGRNQA